MPEESITQSAGDQPSEGPKKRGEFLSSYTKSIVYRIGGTANFEWRVSVSLTPANAVEALKDINRGGRVGFVADNSRLLEIGLPTTYDYDSAKWQEGYTPESTKA